MKWHVPFTQLHFLPLFLQHWITNTTWPFANTHPPALWTSVWLQCSPWVSALSISLALCKALSPAETALLSALCLPCTPSISLGPSTPQRVTPWAYPSPDLTLPLIPQCSPFLRVYIKLAGIIVEFLESQKNCRKPKLVLVPLSSQSCPPREQPLYLIHSEQDNQQAHTNGRVRRGSWSGAAAGHRDMGWNRFWGSGGYQLIQVDPWMVLADKRDKRISVHEENTIKVDKTQQRPLISPLGALSSCGAGFWAL